MPFVRCVGVPVSAMRKAKITIVPAGEIIKTIDKNYII